MNLAKYNIKRDFNKTNEPKRIKVKATVSFPISWNDLDKIKPDSITLKKALKLINEKDPWKDFLK